MLRQGLAEDEDPEPISFPVRFGDYDLLEVLDEGGMGVVYKARHVGMDRVVALKRIRADDLVESRARRRFRREAMFLARIDHPNVVPVYEVGEVDGQPYYTMRLMRGGTLRDVAARFAEPRAAAALVSKLARAVHAIHTGQAGHPKPILHRDLKPANILFDEHGEPYIADFGVAKRLDADATATKDGGAGTVHYMAPEQFRGRTNDPTEAADVWSLGVILYELLARRRPFDHPDEHELKRRIVEEEPEPLDRVRPEVGRSLATVCHTCLAKEPAHRYLSAEALADDLDRYLRNVPTDKQLPGLATRAFRAARRNPWLALGIAATFALIGASIIAAFALAAARERALIAATQESNATGARLVAIAYLEKLERLGRVVAEEAESPELLRLLEEKDEPGLQRWLEDAAARDKLVCGSRLIQDERGIGMARTPALITSRRDFSYRDYFKGAVLRAGKRGLDAVHVSRVYRSSLDDLNKFTISAPVWKPTPEGPRLLGVLHSDLITSPTMGLPARRTALAGPTEDGDGRYLILIHSAYKPQERAVEVGSPRLLALRPPNPLLPELEPFIEGAVDDRPPVTDDDYHDPVAATPGAPPRRWLAAFAPVGNTDLVAVVQQPYDEVVGLDAGRVRDVLLLLCAVPLILFGLGLRAARVSRRIAPS